MFEPFSDDVRLVKDMCVSQCGVHASEMETFLFKNVAVQSSTVPTPMTIRDYIFNELNSEFLYVCQYEEASNFGGTWLYFDESCLCSSLCSTASYFDFTGCADLLNRIGIACTLNNPCTIGRLCPFENTRLTITASDQSSVVNAHINSVCLDICAELAGFGDFATLVALTGTYGVLSFSNVFGLINNPFGTSLGVPAPLIPGRW